MLVQNSQWPLPSHEQQALADLAWFISWVSSSSPNLTSADPPLTLRASAKDSPWVAFGGSYPGNLAAWLKVS